MASVAYSRPGLVTCRAVCVLMACDNHGAAASVVADSSMCCGGMYCRQASAALDGVDVDYCSSIIAMEYGTVRCSVLS